MFLKSGLVCCIYFKWLLAMCSETCVNEFKASRCVTLSYWVTPGTHQKGTNLKVTLVFYVYWDHFIPLESLPPTQSQALSIFSLLTRYIPSSSDWTVGLRWASSSFLWGRSRRQADAKIHVIALPSSLPDQFNEWWQSWTTVKMVTTLWVSGWPPIKGSAKARR